MGLRFLKNGWFLLGKILWKYGWWLGILAFIGKNHLAFIDVPNSLSWLINRGVWNYPWIQQVFDDRWYTINRPLYLFFPNRDIIARKMLISWTLMRFPWISWVSSRIARVWTAFSDFLSWSQLTTAYKTVFPCFWWCLLFVLPRLQRSGAQIWCSGGSLHILMPMENPIVCNHYRLAFFFYEQNWCFLCLVMPSVIYNLMQCEWCNAMQR